MSYTEQDDPPSEMPTECRMCERQTPDLDCYGCCSAACDELYLAGCGEPAAHAAAESYEAYALVDPTTHEVRHVDLYHFAEGSSINGRPYPPPVREWVKSLKPREPIRVLLESLAYNDALTLNENYDAARGMERKWSKWFANSPLLTPGVE
ncbi:MAG TPA: hypothetical protein VK302_11060 [Terriglobales bacterium]|nr:hypothetical protein [Terriglobales bacterium]